MPTQSSVRLNVLGPIRIAGADGSARLTGPRLLGLLAYLVLARPRGLHSRDTLMALFWPEADQAGGRHALRNALHKLRGALGEGAIVVAGDNFVGVNPDRVSCDALEMEQSISDGRTAHALGLYDGELLTGFHVGNAPEFDGWLHGERRRFREALLSAAWAESASHQQRGDLEAAIATARRAVELVPGDESSARRLIALYAASGDRAGALRTYEALATRLQQELGVDPSPVTRAAADAVRIGVPATNSDRDSGSGGESTLIHARAQMSAATAPKRAEIAVHHPERRTIRSRRTAIAISLMLVPLVAWMLTGDASRVESAKVPTSTVYTSRETGIPSRFREDTALFQRYLRAVAMVTANRMPAARDSLQQLVIDAPLYAPAWAALSVALYRSSFYDIPPRDAMPQALSVAKRALTMDNTLADALETFIAVELFGNWNLPASRRMLDSARTLHPQDADFNNLLATWYRWNGDQDSSIALKQRARTLDPLSPRYAIQVAWANYLGHHCEEAVRVYRRLPAEVRAARRANTGLYRSLRCMIEHAADSAAAHGLREEAAVTLRQWALDSGETELGHLLDPPLTPSQRDAAIEKFFRLRLENELARRALSWRPPEFVALLYAERQVRDSSLMWLDSMFVERSMLIHTVPFDPLYDFLRDDPRFRTFVAKLSWLR